jgi:hypothetical protein
MKATTLLNFAIWINWVAVGLNSFMCIFNFSHGRVGLAIWQLFCVGMNTACALWIMNVKKTNDEYEKIQSRIRGFPD